MKKASPAQGFSLGGIWIGMGTTRLHFAIDHGLFMWCWKELLRDERAGRRSLVRL